jgi:hypothetical protein
MLAMVVNDNAGNLTPRGVLGFIASMLAPTQGKGLAVTQPFQQFVRRIPVCRPAK